jgi:hypothetical protein
LHSQRLDYKMKSIVRHSQFNNIIQNYCKFKQNNMHIFTHHVDRLLRSRRSLMTKYHSELFPKISKLIYNLIMRRTGCARGKI